MRIRTTNLTEPVGALLLVIGLAAGVALRLKMFFMNRALWLDPAALALNVVDSDYLGLFLKLPYYNQSAPVGFLLVSKLFGSSFDYSEYSLTFFPLLLSIGALALFAKLSWDLLGPGAAPLAFLPLCVSSTAVYYAGEFKQYSADLFFTILVLLVALNTRRSGFSNRWMLAFGAVGLVSVWFSHTAIITIAGAGLALFGASLLSKNRSAAKQLAPIGGAIATHFLLLYFLQIRPSVADRLFEYWAAGYPKWPFSKAGLEWWAQTIVGYFQFPAGFESSLGAPLLGSALGLVALIFGRRRRFRALLVLCPMLLLLVLAAFELYPLTTGTHDVQSRFTLFTLPFTFLLIGFGYRGLVKPTRFSVPALLILAAFLVYAPALKMKKWPGYIQQDLRPLVQNLRTELRESDEVYVYAHSIPAFRFYTRKKPIPFVAGQAPSNPETSLPADLERLSRDGRVWVVLSHYFGRERQILEQAMYATCVRHYEGKYRGARLLGFKCPGKAPELEVSVDS